MASPPSSFVAINTRRTDNRPIEDGDEELGEAGGPFVEVGDEEWVSGADGANRQGIGDVSELEKDVDHAQDERSRGVTEDEDEEGHESHDLGKENDSDRDEAQSTLNDDHHHEILDYDAGEGGEGGIGNKQKTVIVNGGKINDGEYEDEASSNSDETEPQASNGNGKPHDISEQGQIAAPITKKRKLSSHILDGLDPENVLQSSTSDPTVTPSTTLVSARYCTRSQVGGKPETGLLYNQRYHPMDDYLRPKKVAKLLLNSVVVENSEHSVIGHASSGDKPTDNDLDNDGKKYVGAPSAQSCSYRKSSRAVKQNMLDNTRPHPRDQDLGQLEDLAIEQGINDTEADVDVELHGDNQSRHEQIVDWFQRPPRPPFRQPKAAKKTGTGRCPGDFTIYADYGAPDLGAYIAPSGRAWGPRPHVEWPHDNKENLEPEEDMEQNMEV